MIFRLFSILSVCVLLSACAQTQFAAHTVKAIGKGNVNQSQGKYKVGNPYKIQGKWYKPAERFEYVEQGVASWYGPMFHGRQTANGEIFDKNELTAAHKTLQMPSLVRVTNLENGRSLILRVNDRGPYSRGRILDVSERGAELLGFKNQGTAKIKLEVLSEESRIIANAAKKGMSTAGTEVVMNRRGRLPDGFMLTSMDGPTNVLPKEAKFKDPTTFAGLTGEEIPQGYSGASIKTAKEYTYAKTIPVDELGALDQNRRPIQGHSVAGRVYPAEKVETVAVQPSQIFVQAGSFGSLDNAQALRQKIMDIGPVKLVPTEVQGQRFWRVRVGPIADVNSADTILASIVDRGFRSAMIVVD